MKTKYFTLILVLISFKLYSQLSIELEIRNSLAYITVKNNSTDAYLLPIDTKHLRPFENVCNNFSEQEIEFPSLALMLDFTTRDNKRESYVEGHLSINDFEIIKNRINEKREKEKKKIEKWKSHYGLKNYNEALINYNVVNNLIFLKPKEKKQFFIKIDLHNITSQELLFYNYLLDQNEHYMVNLKYCNIDINKYLTSDQKSKFKKYKIFSNELKSNFVKWNW